MIVQWQLVLVIDAGVDRLAVIGYAVSVNVASTRRENAVWACRCHLEDRRYLEVPGQVKNARHYEAVTLVFSSWAEVNRVKFLEQVLRLQTEIRSCAEPSLRLREGVVSVQLKLIRITFLER